MTLSAMPGSFAPSLPSLPSYPRPFAPSPTTQSSGPPSKKRINRTSYAPQHAQGGFSQHGFSAPPHLHQSLCTPEDSDDGLMSASVYSDRGYRSSLATSVSTSRKRGIVDVDDASDYGRRRPSSSSSSSTRGGGGKRRIIDVVGSTVGGFVRGAWQMFRPRIPFYSSATPAPAPEPSPIEADPPPRTPTYASAAPGFEPSPDTQRRRAESPMPGQYWLDDSPFYTGKSPPTTALSVDTASPRRHFSALDSGMTAKWVVVEPPSRRSRAASTAPGRPHNRSNSGNMTTSSRPRRPVIAARKRGLRPAPALRSPTTLSSPPGSAHGNSTFGFGSGERKKNRRGTSGHSSQDDEMDEDMKRFNDRLKAMIREGKEALGAKVEVVYDDDDSDIAY